MGEWLAATLGPSYLALGAALGQGHFAAAAQPAAPLEAAPPGAYEAWLRLGPPTYWLSLGPAPEPTEANAWLGQSQLLRELDWQRPRNQFMLHSLRREFDVLLVVRDATPTLALP